MRPDPDAAYKNNGGFISQNPPLFLRHLLFQSAMASSNAIQGMYDVALKPNLLRSLLKEYVPDERHPFTSPSDLSRVVSAVKTHRLLSECVPDSADQMLIDSWKSAVDAWVNRLTSLASSNVVKYNILLSNLQKHLYYIIASL